MIPPPTPRQKTKLVKFSEYLTCPSILISTALAARRQGDHGLCVWAERELAKRGIRLAFTEADVVAAILPDEAPVGPTSDAKEGR